MTDRRCLWRAKILKNETYFFSAMADRHCVWRFEILKHWRPWIFRASVADRRCLRRLEILKIENLKVLDSLGLYGGPSLPLAARTDGWAGGWTGGRTDGRTGGRTGGRADGRAGGRADGWADGAEGRMGELCLWAGTGVVGGGGPRGAPYLDQTGVIKSRLLTPPRLPVWAQITLIDSQFGPQSRL